MVSGEEAVALGATGPILRSTGLDTGAGPQPGTVTRHGTGTTTLSSGAIMPSRNASGSDDGSMASIWAARREKGARPPAACGGRGDGRGR